MFHPDYDKFGPRCKLILTWCKGFFVLVFFNVFSDCKTFSHLDFFIRTARWRSLVAGAVVGPSLLLTGHKVRHTSMAIYILLRAAVLAARCGLKSERAGWLFKPLSWKHGDTFLMCLSSCQILYVLLIPVLEDPLM